MTNKQTDSLAGRKVGFIGLGLMGKPMAFHLLNADADLTVWNRSAGPADELRSAGAKVATSISELVEELAGETVILMLKDANVVSEVVEGEGGLLEGLKPNTLVIDMGTTSLEVTRKLAQSVEAKGGEIVDAPVSGGEAGAVNGNLTIMAGGSEENFARALPIFHVVGVRVTHMGAHGAGQVTKLSNQVIVGSTVDAVAEALLLAESAGVDPARVREALQGGFADSRILELQGGKMVRGEFAPGGKATGQIKDLRYAKALADENGVGLPGLEAQVSVWQDMIDAGMGELDHCALFEYLKRKNGRTTEQ